MDHKKLAEVVELLEEALAPEPLVDEREPSTEEIDSSINKLESQIEKKDV